MSQSEKKWLKVTDQSFRAKLPVTSRRRVMKTRQRLSKLPNRKRPKQLLKIRSQRKNRREMKMSAIRTKSEPTIDWLETSCAMISMMMTRKARKHILSSLNRMKTLAKMKSVRSLTSVRQSESALRRR